MEALLKRQMKGAESHKCCDHYVNSPQHPMIPPLAGILTLHISPQSNSDARAHPGLLPNVLIGDFQKKESKRGPYAAATRSGIPGPYCWVG